MEKWLDHVRAMVDDEIRDYQQDRQSREELVERIVRVVRLTTTALEPGPARAICFISFEEPLEPLPSALSLPFSLLLAVVFLYLWWVFT
jgi:hypothetical protein